MNTSKAEQFIERLETRRSPEQLEKHQHLKSDESDEILGVRMGQVFALAKEFIEMPPDEIEKLLKSSIHEVRVGALSIMDKQARRKKTPESRRKELYDLYIRHHDRINNWDLVDLAAPYVVGGYLYEKPRDMLYKLARSKNVWDRRTAMVATGYFIRQGEVNDTFKIAEMLLNDSEDFIHKATGWMLREAGKTDRPGLLRFLDQYAVRMPRMALRYAIEHLDKEQRAYYLSMKRGPGNGITQPYPTPSSGPPTGPDAAAGPLVVSAANPRYFTIASGNAANRGVVYLTGSHIWNNFHDGMGPGSDCAEAPEQFDYDAYLDFLKAHGHNFIRLWRWEQFQSQAAGGSFHLCMTPQPWPRTGPGTARDGQSKFDLDSFDPAYFQRLRDRVITAGNRGIYVAVMLFDGWALNLSPAPDNVEGHPFHAANNVNGIGISSIVDYQVLPLDPRIQALQEAYIRKVVDTVHDLPNVLYEVANESSGGGSVDREFAEMLGLGALPEWGDSTEWQYWVIDAIKRYEQERDYDPHPIGMTMQFPVSDQTQVNDPLFNSAADWISPGYDDEIFASGGHPMAPGSPASRWFDNPPANDGRKVIITDTDHYAPGQGDTLWAWKSFLRGHHPILMDFGLIEGVNPTSSSTGPLSYESFEPARYAMGDTLRFAERMNLSAMEPRGDLSSTGYALVNAGEEYLVLQPSETADPFTVSLDPGIYMVEWFSINSRKTAGAGQLRVESFIPVGLSAPFEAAGPAVLYLKKVGR